MTSLYTDIQAMRPQHLRLCPNCRADFATSNRLRVYCCKECAWRHRAKRSYHNKQRAMGRDSRERET